MLQQKKILVGITGSIAAYKSISLVRLLIKAGAEVRVVMTPAAREFASPLTLATLSKHPVLAGLAEGDNWANHVELGRWADVMIMAPLSCNTMAKMAHGLCDNLLLAVYLSATCPVLVAPAMDEDMWHHPSTRHNLDRLRSYGHEVIPVGTGELASGLFGEGRMAEPEEIVAYLQQHFNRNKELSGRKALVSAGPTYEPIDPVRFIGNHSSGKMGIAIAEELQRRGAEVTLVLGPVNQSVPAGINTIRVHTAQQMFEVCDSHFNETDIAVMAAAVADYTPVTPAKEKIKKAADEQLDLHLRRTTDILKSLGERKRKGQVLVGFALETKDARNYALGKLTSKNADLIVMNTLADEGAGFGTDTNKVTFFTAGGEEISFALKQKTEVAGDITDQITKLLYA